MNGSKVIGVIGHGIVDTLKIATQGALMGPGAVLAVVGGVVLVPAAIVAGTGVGLLQVGKDLKFAAAHAKVDGFVQKVAARADALRAKREAKAADTPAVVIPDTPPVAAPEPAAAPG